MMFETPKPLTGGGRGYGDARAIEHDFASSGVNGDSGKNEMRIVRDKEGIELIDAPELAGNESSIVEVQEAPFDLASTLVFVDDAKREFETAQEALNDKLAIDSGSLESDAANNVRILIKAFRGEARRKMEAYEQALESAIGAMKKRESQLKPTDYEQSEIDVKREELERNLLGLREGESELKFAA